VSGGGATIEILRADGAGWSAIVPPPEHADRLVALIRATGLEVLPPSDGWDHLLVFGKKRACERAIRCALRAVGLR